MRTEEAMHSGVRWIGPETDLRTIARIMKEEDIGALPVGENDRLIGMVTDRDITLRALANGRDVSSLTARDVMTREIVYCRTSESVEDAIHLMESKKIRRLPRSSTTTSAWSACCHWATFPTAPASKWQANWSRRSVLTTPEPHPENCLGA
ncbi:putative transcriptional regulator [Sinorhizobium fredii]